jgi:uracil-DNA glycosylase family 4
MPKRDNFAEFFNEAATGAASTIIVPNVQPKIKDQPYRLAIVGEAPGTDEVAQRTPFVGYSGRDLTNKLSRFGILRDACFIGNICQHQPLGNKIASFDWNGPQIQNGLKALKEDLEAFKPNLCLLLGGTALHAFKSNQPLAKKKSRKGDLSFAYPFPIGRWRGSFFNACPNAPLPNVKCVASYHPAACLRQYEYTPVLMIDIMRAVEEAKFPEWNPPKRQLLINLTFEETCQQLEKLIETKPLVATDIEGGIGTFSCISFATAKDYAFIVPLTKMDGSNFWNLEQEVTIWKLLDTVLSCPLIPKILQNSLYDLFVLQYGYRIVVRGIVDDTLPKHWELYCEARKSLAYMASTLTKEPYWKEMRVQAEQMESEEE